MRKFTIYLLLSSLCYLSASQTPSISNFSELQTFMASDLEYNENKMTRYRNIEGSPYVEEDFIPGTVLYEGKKYTDVPLRYNYYEESFEFETKDDVKLFDPVVSGVDTVWYDDHVYLFLNYMDRNTPKKTYMKILSEGPTLVLEYMRIIKLEREPAAGYQEEKPTRFESRPVRYFVRIAGNPAIEFRNKKSIEEIFADKVDLLEQFAKKNKLKFRQPDDIVKLCTYYDSL